MQSNLVVKYEPKNYMCVTCGVSTQSSVVFQEHVRRHTVDWPYTCGFCSKQMSNLAELRRHLMNQHFKEEPKFTMKSSDEMKNVLQQLIVECDSDRICGIEIADALTGGSPFSINVYLPHQACKIANFSKSCNYFV